MLFLAIVVPPNDAVYDIDLPTTETNSLTFFPDGFGIFDGFIPPPPPNLLSARVKLELLPVLIRYCLPLFYFRRSSAVIIVADRVMLESSSSRPKT